MMLLLIYIFGFISAVTLMTLVIVTMVMHSLSFKKDNNKNPIDGNLSVITIISIEDILSNIKKVVNTSIPLSTYYGKNREAVESLLIKIHLNRYPIIYYSTE